jgi:hypothetical protein
LCVIPCLVVRDFVRERAKLWKIINLIVCKHENGPECEQLQPTNTNANDNHLRTHTSFAHSLARHKSQQATSSVFKTNEAHQALLLLVRKPEQSTRASHVRMQSGERWTRRYLGDEKRIGHECRTGRQVDECWRVSNTLLA